jgi:hypothetical protein
MSQMGYDTKTDRLTDCQSQCDFDLRKFSDEIELNLQKSYFNPSG